MKTLILGLGNPILTDDGVGIHVVRKVQAHLAQLAAACDLAFAEASVGGLRLLEVLTGCGRAILVDAIQTSEGKPGAVYRLGPDDLRTSRHSGSTHDLTLPGALALGRSLGMRLPRNEDISIFAVEAEDVITFGEGCTPAVEAAIPRVTAMVVSELAPCTPHLEPGEEQ